MNTHGDMKTYRDDQGRFITEDRNGLKFVSDEQGRILPDEEGFVTFIGNFGL